MLQFYIDPSGCSLVPSQELSLEKSSYVARRAFQHISPVAIGVGRLGLRRMIFFLGKKSRTRSLCGAFFVFCLSQQMLWFRTCSAILSPVLLYTAWDCCGCFPGVCHINCFLFAFLSQRGSAGWILPGCSWVKKNPIFCPPEQTGTFRALRSSCTSSCADWIVCVVVL